MITNLKASDEQFLSSVRSIGTRLERAHRQISTGLRISTASDDPEQVSALLTARAELSRVTQVDSNLSRVKTEVDTAETAMASLSKLMERASTLGTQGVSDTSSPATRTQLAGEVDALLREAVSLSSTQVEGRYIFGGSTDTVLPFSIDPSPPNAISAYGGSTVRKRALDVTGGPFEVGRTADEIFDNADPDKNVFSSLRALRDALNANDTEAIRTAYLQTNSASEQVRTVHATYGTMQNRVTNASEAAKSAVTRLKTQIASVEDADLTSAILELNQAMQDQQAAFQAKSQLPRGSLFDYLG